MLSISNLSHSKIPFKKRSRLGVSKATSKNAFIFSYAYSGQVQHKPF